MCSLRLAGRSRGLVSIHPRRRRIPRPAPAHTAIVSRSHCPRYTGEGPELRPCGGTVVRQGEHPCRVPRSGELMNPDATSSSSTSATLPVADEMWRDVMAQLRAFVRPRIADPERAEDLVAEILLRIHRNLASLDDRERLPHWVARIARNAVIDEYRRAGPGPRTGRRDRAGRLAGAGRRGGRLRCGSGGVVAVSAPAAERAATGATPRRRDDRPGGDAAGQRRPTRRRLGLRDEVAGATRTPRAGAAARRMLRPHPRRPRSADGLHPDNPPQLRFLRLHRLSAVADRTGQPPRALVSYSTCSSSCSRPRSAPHTPTSTPRPG